MRIILNNVPLTTIEAESITINTSMSDPVPTCQLHVRDNTSSLSVKQMQELLIIDDQVVPNPTNNTILNPSFNPWTTAWGNIPVTGTTLSQVGGGGVNVACSNVALGGWIVLLSGGGNLQQFYTPGQTYMGSVYVQGTSPVNLGAYIQINWYDAAFNNIALTPGTQTALVSTSLTRYTVSSVCPPNGAFASLALGVVVSSNTNSGTVTFTQAQMEPEWFPNSVSYPSPWCGPNQANCKQLTGPGTWIRQYRKFAGYVNHAIAQNYHGNARQWQIDAVGYAWLLGTVLGTQNYNLQTDAFVFNNLTNQFFTQQFFVGNNVITGITLNTLQLNYDDPRTIFDGLCGMTGFFWTVDPYWEVYYQPPGYTTMPIQLICDNSAQPDFVTKFPAYNFSSEMDYTQPGSVILVIGNGTNVAEVIDPNAVSSFQKTQLYGNGLGQQFMRKINDSTLGNVNDCVQRGIAELLLYDNPRYIYHLSTNVELKAGQGIALTSATEGLNQSVQLIQQVQAKWIGTDETLHDVWEYQADLGSVNRGATNIMSRLARKGNQNTSAPAISTTALATIENLGITDTTGYNTLTGYAATILADTPLAYYRLDEISGTTANDASGNARNGTLNGGITLGTHGLLQSGLDTAMTFNGSTGYISLPTAFVPTGAHAWSIECWCKPSSLPASGGYACMVSMGGFTTGQTAQIKIHNNAGTTQFMVATFNGDISGGPTLSTGTIYHVVGTYDGTSTRLYVNGSLVAGPTNFTLNLVASYADIGADGGVGSTTEYFNGVIDEAAYYNYALSSAQVSNHYSAGTS